MIKYDGMKSEEAKSNVKYLPAGPYVAQVLKVSIEGNEPDQQRSAWTSWRASMPDGS